MRIRSAIVLCGIVLAAACGSKTPTAPSSSQAGTGNSRATATPTPVEPTASRISGSVVGTAQTIAVVGVDASAPIDDSGRFSLLNVPMADDVQLRVSGSGTDAVVSVGRIQPSESVEVTIVVAGSAARLENAIHHGAVETEIEGTVSAVAGSTITVAGRTIGTDASTQFTRQGAPATLAAVRVGTRVEAHGSMSGDVLVATRVNVEDALDAQPPQPQPPQPEPEPGDDHGGNSGGNTGGGDDHGMPGNDGQQTETEAEGTLGAIQGTCPAVTSTVGTTRFATTASTVFEGVTCATLKSGDRVNVKGTKQADGSISATRVRRK